MMSAVVQKTFPLIDPVKNFEGDEVTEITLRKPKGKDLRAFDQEEGEIAGMFELLSRLSGLPVRSIDEMDPRDISACSEWAEGFFTKSRKGGKKSSQTPPTPSTSNPPTSGK